VFDYEGKADLGKGYWNPREIVGLTGRQTKEIVVDLLSCREDRTSLTSVEIEGRSKGLCKEEANIQDTWMDFTETVDA